METFLIDSWDQTKQDKQTKFLRQPVSLSADFISFDWHPQTRCLGKRVGFFKLKLGVFNMKRMYLTARCMGVWYFFMAGISFRGCSFFFWPIQLKLNVWSNNCHILLPFFFWHCCSQVASIFKPFSILLLKTFHSNSFSQSLQEGYVGELRSSNHRVQFCASQKRCSKKNYFALNVQIFHKHSRLTWNNSMPLNMR